MFEEVTVWLVDHLRVPKSLNMALPLHPTMAHTLGQLSGQSKRDRVYQQAPLSFWALAAMQEKLSALTWVLATFSNPYCGTSQSIDWVGCCEHCCQQVHRVPQELQLAVLRTAELLQLPCFQCTTTTQTPLSI